MVRITYELVTGAFVNQQTAIEWGPHITAYPSHQKDAYA